MKKLFTSLFMLGALVSMNAQDVYILGNVGEQDWGPHLGTQMEMTADDTYEYEGHFGASSYFSFSTMLGETSADWDVIRPYRFGASSNAYDITDNLLGEPIQCGDYGDSADNAFLFSTGGVYHITLLLSDRLVMFERKSTDIEEPPVDEGHIYIIGSVDGAGSWSTNAGIMMDEPGNGIFTAYVNVSDSAANFSFTHALAPSAANWAAIQPFRFAAVGDTDDNTPVEVILGRAMGVTEDGVSEPSFQITQGYYAFTLNMNDRTLTVEAAEKEDAMYIVGNNPFGNWDPAKPMKMTKSGNVYTAEATIEGDVWFIFSGDFGSWDAVNALRYGPLSADEDEVVEPEQVVTTQLSTGGKSYKITGNGDYVITFDKENLTFTFAAKNATKGDVNGDGIVDVDDLNLIVNMMLNKIAKTDAADINGDGTVDVEDMNGVINIMLGKA